MVELLTWIIICMVSYLDGVRDANVARKAPWWSWHLVKWVSFYLPLVWILYLIRINVWHIPILAFVAWIFWQLGYGVKLETRNRIVRETGKWEDDSSEETD